MRKKRAAQLAVHIPLGRAGWEAFGIRGEFDRVGRLIYASNEMLHAVNARIDRMPDWKKINEIRREIGAVSAASKRIARADNLFSDVSASTRKANDAYAMARNLTERLDALEAKLCPV